MSFNHVDSFTLANTLTQAQLRQEIRTAEMHAGIEAYFEGTPYATGDAFPWVDYADCCREALSTPPKPSPLPARGQRIDFRDIKQRVDIVDVVWKYVDLRKAGANRFVGLCLFHPDKHPSFYVYGDRQTFKCYGCQAGGDVFEFIMRIANTDIKGAAAILGGV